MSDKKTTKEIHHNTQFEDKQLPTITIERKKQNDMTSGSETYISVSDKTSRKAFNTLKRIKEEGYDKE